MAQSLVTGDEAAAAATTMYSNNGNSTTSKPKTHESAGASTNSSTEETHEIWNAITTILIEAGGGNPPFATKRNLKASLIDSAAHQVT